MISLIVAHDPQLVIGKGGEIPWHYSEDLKYFKKVTMGSIIVMGRKTFESIGKALPGRINIVLTSNQEFYEPNIQTVGSFKEIENLAETENIFIIGGSTLYQYFLPKADRLFITEIYKSFEGDTYFPEYRKSLHEDWIIKSRKEYTDFCFNVYQRA